MVSRSAGGCFSDAGPLLLPGDLGRAVGYLAREDLTDEHDQGEAGAGASTFRGAGLSGQLRDSGEFARLAFGGLELVPPGVTLVSEWRQEGDDGAPHPRPAEVNCYGGVGRKPTA